MKISVIVPVYNEEEYLDDCLQSIFAQTRKADEVLIVDNNSTDSSVQIAKKYPVKIVREKIQGMTPARNRGFNSARGDIIARTDADTKVPKNWLLYIEKQFQKDPGLVAFSGPLKLSDVPSLVQASNWPSLLVYEFFKQITKHDCLFGPNMAVRKTAWQKIKNKICMDDKIVHEDLDLAIHIARVGKVKFDTELVVSSSSRRWKKLPAYFEYPYRHARTLQRHSFSLKKSKHVIKKVLSKKILNVLFHE